ncbi:Uncharacterised protein [Legionella wadsworthii]|uniref:Transmembrane protein n=1 Tax=Legionella wadsworthii TaxID=28088 RepID=A0A378LYC6_9GAMM|nr:hypothetical protein [Legionella wadsworthii]STY31839.1 Uncharacterised protein [Legionella wadsworthii]
MILKSALNGIGTGAGVAWPFFGILFAVVGGSVASFLSLALGIVSITLFISVGFLIFYLSYQEQKTLEQEFQQQFIKNKTKLSIDILDYIKSIEQIYYYENPDLSFNEFFKIKLDRDLIQIGRMDKTSSLYKILSIMKEEYESNQSLPKSECILQRIAHLSEDQPVPLYTKITPSFCAFVGAFGSLAGCSAGISGLLTGIGVFTSFAAFPLLGCGILAFALITATLLAYEVFLSSEEDFTKKQNNKMMKEMHQQLSKATLERLINTTYASKSLLTPGENEQISDQKNQNMPTCLFTLIKPGISFFNHEKMNPLLNHTVYDAYYSL